MSRRDLNLILSKPVLLSFLLSLSVLALKTDFRYVSKSMMVAGRNVLFIVGDFFQVAMWRRRGVQSQWNRFGLGRKLGLKVPREAISLP